MNPTATTLPGHERDIGRTITDIEWELAKLAERNVIGAPLPDGQEALLLENFRRRGIPAVSAERDGDYVVIDVATPQGHG